MSDITPSDPEIPDEAPEPDDGTPEVEDQPLGPPADMPEEDAPLPGLPENEPPASRRRGPPVEAGLVELEAARGRVTSPSIMPRTPLGAGCPA
jgi:hypothetical protein